MLRDEEEAAKRRAIKRRKETEKRCEELEEQLELAQARLLSMEKASETPAVDDDDDEWEEEVLSAAVKPEPEPVAAEVPEENGEPPLAAESEDPHIPPPPYEPSDQDVWVCRWHFTGPDGSLTRCGKAWTSREVSFLPC